MTEAEAKTKWCPMARRLFGAVWGEMPAASANRPVGDDGACIASSCMMWRWDLGANPDYDKKIGAPMMLDNKTEGHCGLAGKL